MELIDLTPIFEAVIALAAAIITVLLIPWIRARTTAQQRNDLEVWVRIAVAAAEQIFAGQGQGQGSNKKRFVMDFLKERGLWLDEAKVTPAVVLMIEAAVLELNREGMKVE